MTKQSEAKPPPGSTDREGWQQAVADHRLSQFRLETIVAALQDLGQDAGTPLRNALAKHLSDALTGFLRRHIGTNHPNAGEDIIYRVHNDVFEALLQKDSKDGQALREAFGPRVMFRVKDAIAAEYRHSRIPLAPKVREVAEHEHEDDVATDSAKAQDVNRLAQRGETGEATEDASGLTVEEATAVTRPRDPALLDGVRATDEHIDVERALANIKDFRKRLAFRLYMDDVPFKSKRSDSIAKAVGVSSKTAEAWIKEVRELLAQTEEVQALQGKKVGERP
jgi:hypothetical protein